MTHLPLYRDVNARDLLELFFVSAVTSLLLVRLYLEITGFPQIGGGGLHIAHVLFGGILMLAALTIALAFLGSAARRLTAILGGIGFGVFIDEIGKFITHDNDYFFRPAIGIIYAIFVIIYLVFNFLTRHERLSQREYQLNALNRFEEAIAHDLDPFEKQSAKSLLARTRSQDPITRLLYQLFDSAETVPREAPSRLETLLQWVDKKYASFWRTRGSGQAVQVFFVAEATVFLAGILFNIYPSLDSLLDFLSGQITYGGWLIFGQVVSALTAAIVAIVGARKLNNDRVAAFELFRRATLINLFLTEFFIFSRIELEALPGFFLNLALLLLVNLSLAQERRMQHKKTGR
jgi:hypothetical protein